jgi:putative methyltransferase (TIGR04325 family)
MKKIIKDIIPPILLRLLLKSPAPKVFVSFAQAATSSKCSTYEQDELIDVVLKKNEIFRALPLSNQLLSSDAVRILMAIGLARNDNKINVVDFGGGGGNHLTIAKIGFSDSVAFDWNIVETPKFVEKARKFSVPNLRYFDGLKGAVDVLPQIDLLLVSSTLQYCPDPIGMLHQLTMSGAKHLYLTRTPFNSGAETIFSTQASWLSKNGPGPLPAGFQDRQISYPIGYASRSKVEEVLGAKYEIVFKADEGEASAFKVKDEKISMAGYFCKIK